MPAQLQGITPSIADKLRAAGVHGLAKLLFLDAYNLEGITVRTADANVWVTTLKYCACVRDVCRRHFLGIRASRERFGAGQEAAFRC